MLDGTQYISDTVSYLDDIKPHMLSITRYDLDVDLDSLTRVLHLLVRLGAMLFLRLFLLRHSFPMQEPPQAFHAARVSSLSQPSPQLHHTDLGVTAVHVADERELLLGVLVRMVICLPPVRYQGD